MNLLKLYLKLSKIFKEQKGFTLIELLVAILMAGIITVGLGTGMVAILSNSNSSSAKTDLKNQLNRAVDYINEDIRRSRFASIITTDEEDDTVRFTYFTNAKDTTPYTIDYRLEIATNPWLPPNVLTRRENGGNWQVLVDGISDDTSITFPACDTTSEAISKTSYDYGFQACVEEAESTSGVKIYQVGISLFGALSSSETLEVSTRTIARSLSQALEPPALSIDDPTDSTPIVNWSEVEGISAYLIYRCRTTALTCTPDENDDLFYSGTNLTKEETTETEASRSCYIARSSDGINFSEDWSNVVCGALSTGGKPLPITNLTASPETQPTVSWAEAETATSYKLYRCSTPNVETTPCTINVADSSSYDAGFPIIYSQSQYDTSNGSPHDEANSPAVDSGFCYAVVATNSFGDSTISNTDCGLLLTNTAPATPDLLLSPSNTNVVNWTSVSGATSYTIKQCDTDLAACTTTDSFFTGFPTDSMVSSETGYNYAKEQTASIGDGRKWCYQIQATNASGSSPWSNLACGNPVIGKTVIQNFTSVEEPSFIWTEVSGATSYEVWRCETPQTDCDPGSEGQKIKTVTDNNRAYDETIDSTDVPTPDGYKYCYAVKSINATGSSFSTASCGAKTASFCTVPSVLNGSTDTSAKRTAISDLFTDFTEVSYYKPTFGTTQQVTGLSNTSTNQDLSGGEQLACSTPIQLTWHFTDNITPTPSDFVVANLVTASLSWTPVLGSDFVSYDVYRCRTGANVASCTITFSALSGHYLTRVNTNSYVNTANLPGMNRKYCYAVVAVDAINGSSTPTSTLCGAKE